MTVYLAWAPGLPDPAELVGPWSGLHLAAPGLLLVESEDSLSKVFHELKWSLPRDAQLFVAPLGGTPKLRYLEPGTLAWLRERTSPPGA